MRISFRDGILIWFRLNCYVFFFRKVFAKLANVRRHIESIGHETQKSIDYTTKIGFFFSFVFTNCWKMFYLL